MRQPGRITTAMAARLSAMLGCEMTPDDLWYQEGFYRRATQDMARWGACYRRDGRPTISVYSWDTMTECLRAGFVLRPSKDNPAEFEASAVEPDNNVYRID